jgi:site-specific recombinase XerD
MTLSQAVRLYIERKQAAGMRFTGPANTLHSFLRCCGDIDLHRIQAGRVVTFLGGSSVMPNTWNSKLGTLRAFLDYWVARGRLKSSTLPRLARKTAPSFVPYIYSKSDLRALIQAIPRRRIDCVMSGATFRTLLLFLYGTGVRLGEALRLRLMDVNLTLGLVTVRDTKFYKTRLVPLGSDVQKLMRQHVRQSTRQHDDHRRLFQTKRGDPLTNAIVYRSFCRVRRVAGIGRSDNSSCQPRLHDLRHTFAVHRVTEWYKEKKDLQRLLPALSTYLGHVNLNGTQRYLTMTPELLQLASHRFERYVWGGADEK